MLDVMTPCNVVKQKIDENGTTVCLVELIIEKKKVGIRLDRVSGCN